MCPEGRESERQEGPKSSESAALSTHVIIVLAQGRDSILIDRCFGFISLIFPVHALSHDSP